MDKRTYAVWWTTQADCEKIGEPHSYSADLSYWIEKYGIDFRTKTSEDIYDLDASTLPEYIKNEYSSRYGRAGRGRLWVSQEFDNPEDIWVIFHHDPGYEGLINYVENAGGIVIKPEDADILRKLPGLITDLELKWWFDSL